VKSLFGTKVDGNGRIRLLAATSLITLATSLPLPAQEMKSTFTPDDVQAWKGKPLVRTSERIAGYRGIWFALGFKFPYGDKYSGGLGTYTANHQPMAVYAPAANKTFFTYGGTPSAGKRELAIMVSYFDHATGQVPQPVILYLDPSVDDPHDNASIQLDKEGYVWVFKSGRGVKRPGLIFRSEKPYSIDAFACVSVQEFTYPQAWYDSRKGFLLLFAKYKFFDKGGPERDLYWKTSRDGLKWSRDRALATFEGHYQTSGQHGRKIATFFNWHPGHNNDLRTNVYYAQSTDWGKTWTTAGGKPLKLPLEKPKNGALIDDLRAKGKLMYTCDVNFDREGNPILLYVTSRAGEPGPKGDPREWTVAHWKDAVWRQSVITTSGHNYDMGSLTVMGDRWIVIGPTGKKPQAHGTGGEMVMWVSRDEGKTWRKNRQITSGSAYNQSYARRPQDSADPFFSFWADGSPNSLTKSRLYFTDSTGGNLWRLPYDMKGKFAKPRQIR
jgi:hypothetical protein